MESTFSEALSLNGMSSTTAYVVWAMTAFLIALVVGIFIFFKKQIQVRKTLEGEYQKTNKAKGF